MELLSVPLIMAIVQALKQSGMDSKYAPLVSISIGLLFGLLVVNMGVEGLVQGLIAGLAASGLWSSGKATIQTLSK